ncbi:TonB-dependent receptor plug domain-containing protein [Thalassotalea sp. PLHSN55]|uniref:TonB-dependent receptor plug domain-containing protein n=1 Tax=Thalassotalea sp. PLHSN55 TaxID=3435888 RepID=UPI003F85EBEE
MYSNSKIAKAVRLAMFAGAATTATISTSAFSAETGAEEVERIEVTGSRIKRSEFESASPISVFDADQIKASGVASVDEFLKDIPSFSGFQMGASTNNGSDTGQKKVDLRGLEFNRTLVLINGRRQIGDVNGDGAVDIGAVPIGMVKRIEVLRDGASTIYGADAIAGVVNIILKDDVEGIEMSVNWGAGTEDGQAENVGFSIVAGTASDKGSFTMGIEYSQQSEMKQDEKDWALETLYPILDRDPTSSTFNTFQPQNSASSNSRKITLANGDTYIVDEATGRTRPFGKDFDGNRVDDTYNYAPVNALVTPNERFQFAANGKYEYIDDHELYMETLYTRRTSHQRLAPDASFNTPGIDQKIPASNPHNPFGDTPNNDEGISGEAVTLNRRFTESGGRIYEQAADTFRMVLGGQGYLNDTLGYDISFTYAENETIEETKNLHRIDRWNIMVDPAKCAANDACTTAVGADGFNPFAPYGSITDDELGFLMANSLKNLSWGRMMLFQAGLNGEAESIDFGSGALGWAAGFEHRFEEGRFSPDEFMAEGLTTSGASPAQKGSFTVDELYVEMNMPVTNDLTVDASLRYSDYDTVGDTTNFKIGVDYQVLDWAKVRGGFSTGFRAPNITEINQVEAADNPVVENWCEFMDRRTDITDTMRTNCLALGVPSNDDSELGFAYQSSVTEKAPAKGSLKPEESESFTIGMVLTPIENLSISFDYWDITVDNLIGVPRYNDLSHSCLDSTNLSSPACSVFRDWDGEASGPIIFDLYPADAVLTYGNLGELSTNGLDIDVQYTMDVDFGFGNQLDFRWSATNTFTREETFGLTGTNETVGTASGFAVYPELKMNASANLSADDWNIQWAMRYIGETDDAARPASITDDAVAEDIIYHDLSGSYTFGTVSFAVGLSNLTDEDAPRFHSAFNANTEPGTYDVIGRRIFGTVNVKF